MIDVKNLNITVDFNEEADVLHISLGTGEPSFCEEVDDVILIERGYFSKQITGFQVMDVKHHGIKGVELHMIVQRVQKALQAEKRDFQKYMKEKAEAVPIQIQSRLSGNKRTKRLFQEA